MGRKKYIPHLAEFHFKPKYNWSHSECKQLYETKNSPQLDKIIYDDCIKIMKSMESESVDVIIADPPFGINFSGKEKLYNRKSSNVIDGYNEIIDDYERFSNEWISQLPRIMKPTSSAWIISGYTNLEFVLKAIRNSGLNLINQVVWKYQFGPYTSRKFSSSHYNCLFVVKNVKKYFFHQITHYNIDVWDNIPRTYKADQKKNGTKLPEELVKRMIDFSSKPGDLVFDPFMGNGTTAVTAKINYRHYLGCEINQQIKPILEENIGKVEIGEDYIPYHERLMSPEEMAKIDSGYKKAYQIYSQEKGNQT